MHAMWHGSRSNFVVKCKQFSAVVSGKLRKNYVLNTQSERVQLAQNIKNILVHTGQHNREHIQID